MAKIKGQVISGEFGKILVRQKSDEPIELGELLVASTPAGKVLLTAYDLSYGSQISQQNLELISGMHLEENQAINFYEPHLRNYTVAHLKSILSISNSNEAKSAKGLPNFFSTVSEIEASDVTFLSKPKHSFSVGNLRSGSKTLNVPIYLDTKEVLSHHILIPATTGKGKSNLMYTMLWNLLPETVCASLVFDPHDEYYGRNGNGLKDHPQWTQLGSYYTVTSPPPGALSLKLNLKHITPRHFSGAVDFTTPQYELMQVYHNLFGDDWIRALLLKEKYEEVAKKFMEGTYAVVNRRLSQLLDLDVANDKVLEKGIYSFNAGESTLADITKRLSDGKTVIIDSSSLSGRDEIFLSSLITSAVFDAWKNYRKQGTLSQKPVVSIVLEEAPRVLGKEVLEKGPNIFATIAREGRKFGVGLIAITQLPSLIPKDILANMNTKIIMGIEMATERQAVIESAAQDLSDDARAIASLDKGEAIVTSNFTRFAIPIRIPLFAELITQTKIDAGKKSNGNPSAPQVKPKLTGI